MLSALNVAFLSCCAISRAPDRDSPPPPGKVDLELRNTGVTALVQITRGAARIIAVAISGDEGEALVKDANTKLNGVLEEISARVARER